MSRIGKLPVAIPSGVEVNLNGQDLSVKGPKGTLGLTLVDDVSASKMARDIVKKIEDTLVYPGQIKVMVIRESRAIEIAR